MQVQDTKKNNYFVVVFDKLIALWSKSAIFNK